MVSCAQLWNLEEILQDSENARNQSGGGVDNGSDNDNDGMDVDDNVPKPSKGAKKGIIYNTIFYCYT